jgi:HAD superfamily hydrolase (TIGR01509 family)
MHVDPVRAVVFDVGNTLWFMARIPDPAEIERLQAAPLRSLLTAWGITLVGPAEEIVRAVQVAGDEGARVEQARGSLREVNIPLLLRGALADRDMEISAKQADELWRETWIPERKFGVQLYPDSLDVLAEVKAMGPLIGICTNRPCTAEMHLPGLEDFGMAQYVDAVVCSGDTGYVKPHPSTFKLVLERLGVPPHEAVMVGDSAAIDIRGAKSVGMRTIWKLNGRYDLPPCADADFAIHDLAELLSLPILPRRSRPVVSGESLTPHEDGNEDRY